MSATPIQPFLNLRGMGKSLKEMGSDMLQTSHQNVVSHWYHSDLDADVIVWKDEKQNIIKQQVNLLGQVVEWNIVDGLRTGLVIETERKLSDKASGEKKSNNLVEIQFDAKPAPASVTQAIELISYTQCLTEQDKKIISDNLSKAPKMDMMDPVEFMHKFGYKKQASILPTWWQKLIRRFKK